MAGNITSTLTTNPTAYGTYGVYGYNGEYTHTSLGLQYLRARYLNVATGTFTSKDTYAGRMQDILSQNRYTYAENNPVGHSDPSGHAVKSGISSILKKAANTIKAAVTGQSSGNVKKGNTPTPNIAAAYKSSSLNYVRAQAQLNASLAKAEQSRAKAELIEKPLEWYQGATNATIGTINWIRGIAAQAEYKMCIGYDYCQNKVQQAIQQTGNGLLDVDKWLKNNIPDYLLPDITPVGVAGGIIERSNYLYQSSLLPQPNHEDKENLPDYTDIIQARMDQTVQEYQEYQMMNGSILTAIKFYNDVKTNGNLDIKSPEQWNDYFKDTEIEEQPDAFMFRGEKIDPGTLGNQMYGYLGNQIGFPQPILYLGGGWAQIKEASWKSNVSPNGSLTPEEAKTFSYIEAFSCWYLPNYGDAPEDHEAVKEGLEWYIESLSR